MSPSRPHLLDLFCGGGGAAVGYSRAGFEVVGVDVEEQPDYPFTMLKADAIKVLDGGLWKNFDAVHASPPCQGFTNMSNRHRGRGSLADKRPDLLTPTLERLRRLPVPWVVENVPGAWPLRPTVKLSGPMFGLPVWRLRWFESNIPLSAPPPPRRSLARLGVIGRPDGRRLYRRKDGSVLRAASSVEEAAAALGVPWMKDWRSVKEAVPPAYTEWIGRQLLRYVHAVERAIAVLKESPP
jgi:DNA (cytosine-5)-methyltransferase 1